MRTIVSLGILLGALLKAGLAVADVTDTTPYDYNHPPKPGRERGTYAFNGSGALGDDCYVSIVIVGVAKFLPNAAGGGGDLCLKFNFEAKGTGLFCPPAMLAQGSIGVLGGPYTYNGDGTICENLHFIGGALNGMPATFHTYLDPKGRWILPTGQNIAYPCPGVAPNGQVIGHAVGFKISKVGDDPPGSGMLNCTNP
jgi:hypothetical protein